MASVISMLAIGEGSKQEILQQIEQLGTRQIIITQSALSPSQKLKAQRSKSQGLSLQDAVFFKKNFSDHFFLAACKSVKAHLKEIPQALSYEVLAISPTYQKLKGLELKEGRWISELDLLFKMPVCVLGFEMAKSLGRVGRVGKFVLLENLPFKVIGILKKREWSEGKNKSLTTRNLNQSLFFPLGTEDALQLPREARQDFLSEIIVEVKENESIEASTLAIKRFLEVRHQGVKDYEIIVPNELLKQAEETHKLFNFILGSIAAISMLVGGIGIMNIMLASVSDRTREIGIRRAIGANQFQIAKQFLVESLILTFFGTILGLLGGCLLATLIEKFAGWPTIITAWSLGMSLLMALCVGLASGLYPAIKAARMDPIVALRYY